MTGGRAFVYDPEGTLEKRLNPEAVQLYRLETDAYADECKAMIEAHVAATYSKWAEGLLAEWDRVRHQFWHVVPHEIAPKLEEPLTLESAAKQPAE